MDRAQYLENELTITQKELGKQNNRVLQLQKDSQRLEKLFEHSFSFCAFENQWSWIWKEDCSPFEVGE